MRVLFVMITVATAARLTWEEEYLGVNVGSVEADACTAAKNVARTNAGAACLIRKGHKTSDVLGSCDCTSVKLPGDGVLWTCTVEVEISCESNADR